MAEKDPVIKTGVSQKTDPAEAVQELYEAIYQPNISFAIFYCAASYDLGRLECALSEKFKDIPLIGCTTAGEITPEGMLDGAITGFTISSKKLKVESVLLPLEDITGEQIRSAHQALGAQISRQPLDAEVNYLCDEGVCEGRNGFALLLIDGVSQMEEQVTGALAEVLSGMSLVGGVCRRW
jgi:hypothetical protein